MSARRPRVVEVPRGREKERKARIAHSDSKKSANCETFPINGGLSVPKPPKTGGFGANPDGIEVGSAFCNA